jgi:hypothetical protein
MSPASLDAASLIDRERYPIDAPESARYLDLVAHGRQSLAENGSLALDGFLSPSGLSHLQAEAAALVPRSQRSAKLETPYGTACDSDAPKDHPSNIQNSSQRHCVAHHMMPETALDALYRWPPMRKLVADLVGKPKLFLHEDPSNALVLMIYRTSDHLAWHFDRAHYSTIIALQTSDAGGAFEYVPRLRSADDECFDDVKGVLMGDRSRVIQSRSRPGAFTIMEGDFSIHRVTPVEGATPRISMVLSYEDEPGIKLDVATRKFFFGDDAPDDP